MNRRFFTPTAFVALALVGCADSGSTGGSGFYEGAALDSNDQKASYGVGLNMGRQLIDAADRLDHAALLRGINDGMNENDSELSDEELQTVLQQFSQDIQAAAAARAEAESAENAAAGEAYLAENGAREGVITTESGLQYEVLRDGDGPSPTIEDTARLHYRGTLIDGTEFDSSYSRGEPSEFAVGGLIQGFTEALMLMNVGSHLRIVIPADIAYGPGGSGRIGPNSTLIFEIELLEIL